MSNEEWHFTLPDGWSSERMYDKRWALYLIRTPRGEMLTVDFTNRRFAAGCRGPITPASESLTKRTFSHRGWHQKLVNEAVEWARRELGAS